MSAYQIIDTNAENIGACSFCGYYKPGRTEGYRRKLKWLKERYAEGLRYKVLRSREFGDIGMIEYAPGNRAWRPVEAEGYLVIHCLMVLSKHKGKGLGSFLLDSCLTDARKSKCRGVAVVTSSDSFMAKRDLFIKAGFVSVDCIPPYELLVKKFNKRGPEPRFIVDRERLCKRYSNGLTILAAEQCPYVTHSVAKIAEASRRLGLEPKVVRIGSAEASRELPTPYGIFSIIYDGKIIAERPLSATRFRNLMRRNVESGRRSLQLETPSLVLRPLALSDTPRILEMSQEECARRWLPSQVYRDKRQAAVGVKYLIKQFDLRTNPKTNIFVFGIQKRATGRLIGHVGLSPLFNTVEVGFGIAESEQGKGYATEAVSRACVWALGQFSLPAILGVTDAGNLASQRVLLRSGFRRKEEKRMRFQGVERPVVIYEFTGERSGRQSETTRFGRQAAEEQENEGIKGHP